MAERRYRLMVRACDLPYWVTSAFGYGAALTWPEVLAACREAVRSPGAAHRRYRVEGVRGV